MKCPHAARTEGPRFRPRAARLGQLLALLALLAPAYALGDRPPAKKGAPPPPRASAKAATSAKASTSKPDVARPPPSASASAAATPDDDESDDEESPAAAASGSAAASGATATAAAASARRHRDDETEGNDSGELAGGVDLDLNARYVWRGLALSRGSVLQPSAWVSRYGLTLLGWGNVNINPDPGGRFSSFLPILQYEFQLGLLRLEPQLIGYYFPRATGESTAEAGLGLSYPVGAIRLIHASYVDVYRHSSSYFGSFGVEHSRALSRSLHVRVFTDLGVGTAGFNRAYLGVSTGALNVLEGGVALRYALSDWLDLSLHTELSGLLAPSLRDAASAAGGDGNATIVNGGVTLAAEL